MADWSDEFQRYLLRGRDSTDSTPDAPPAEVLELPDDIRLRMDELIESNASLEPHLMDLLLAGDQLHKFDAGNESGIGSDSDSGNLPADGASLLSPPPPLFTLASLPPPGCDVTRLATGSLPPLDDIDAFIAQMLVPPPPSDFTAPGSSHPAAPSESAATFGAELFSHTTPSAEVKYPAEYTMPQRLGDEVTCAPWTENSAITDSVPGTYVGDLDLQLGSSWRQARSLGAVPRIEPHAPVSDCKPQGRSIVHVDTRPAVAARRSLAAPVYNTTTVRPMPVIEEGDFDDVLLQQLLNQENQETYQTDNIKHIEHRSGDISVGNQRPCEITDVTNSHANMANTCQSPEIEHGAVSHRIANVALINSDKSELNSLTEFHENPSVTMRRTPDQFGTAPRPTKPRPVSELLPRLDVTVGRRWREHHDSACSDGEEGGVSSPRDGGGGGGTTSPDSDDVFGFVTLRDKRGRLAKKLDSEKARTLHATSMLMLYDSSQFGGSQQNLSGSAKKPKHPATQGHHAEVVVRRAEKAVKPPVAKKMDTLRSKMVFAKNQWTPTERASVEGDTAPGGEEESDVLPSDYRKSFESSETRGSQSGYFGSRSSGNARSGVVPLFSPAVMTQELEVGIDGGMKSGQSEIGFQTFRGDIKPIRWTEATRPRLSSGQIQSAQSPATGRGADRRSMPGSLLVRLGHGRGAPRLSVVPYVPSVPMLAGCAAGRVLPSSGLTEGVTMAHVGGQREGVAMYGHSTQMKSLDLLPSVPEERQLATDKDAIGIHQMPTKPLVGISEACAETTHLGLMRGDGVVADTRRASSSSRSSEVLLRSGGLIPPLLEDVLKTGVGGMMIRSEKVLVKQLVVGGSLTAAAGARGGATKCRPVMPSHEHFEGLQDEDEKKDCSNQTDGSNIRSVVGSDVLPLLMEVERVIRELKERGKELEHGFENPQHFSSTGKKQDYSATGGRYDFDHEDNSSLLRGRSYTPDSDRNNNISSGRSEDSLPAADFALRKHALVLSSRQLVTASKLMVRGAATQTRADFVQHFGAGTATLSRMCEDCAAVLCSAPRGAAALVASTLGAARAYRGAALAGDAAAMQGGQGHPGVDALMRRATLLAEALAAHMQTVKGFEGPSGASEEGIELSLIVGGVQSAAECVGAVRVSAGVGPRDALEAVADVRNAELMRTVKMNLLDDVARAEIKTERL